MKTASTILLIASGAAVLAAIWAPVGAWWQWAITALVLLLAAAGTGGAAAKHTHPIDGPELMPEDIAREFVPDTTLEQVEPWRSTDARRSYGRKAD